MLGSLLELMEDVMEDDNLQKDSLNEVAECVSLLLQKHPNIKLSCPSNISAITNALVSTLLLEQQHELDSIRVNALLNVSCLLLKNYVQTPWMNDLLMIASSFEELEILQEKSMLLLKLTQNIEFLYSQIDQMDIDQNTYK
jgi:hypothetical protein